MVTSMNRIKSFALLVGLLGLPVIAQASSGSNEITDVGQKVINFILYGQEVPKDGASLLSTVSGVLNLIALFFMAALSILGGLNFIIYTANKGKIGGEVISSFWMPIRISTATILLVPLISGFSTIQYLVRNVAEAGNEHAAYLTTKGLEHIVNEGTYRPPMLADSYPFVGDWLTSEVCRLYIDSKEKREAIVANPIKSLTTSGYAYGMKEKERTGVMNWVPGFRMILGKASPRQTYCGTVSISIPTRTLNTAVATEEISFQNYAAQTAAKEFPKILRQVQPDVEAIAKKIMADEYALADLQKSGVTKQGEFENKYKNMANVIEGSGNDIQKAAEKLDKLLVAATTKIVSEHQNKFNKAESKWHEEISAKGWTALGTSYWYITKQQQRINDTAALFRPTVSPPELDGDYIDDERLHELFERVTGLANTSQRSDGKSGTIKSINFSGADSTNDVAKRVPVAISKYVAEALFTSDDDGNLIGTLQKNGSLVTATLDVALYGFIGAKAITDGALEASKQAADAGSKAFGGMFAVFTGPAATIGVGKLAFLSSLFDSASSIVKSIYFPMMLGGFVLAVILPAIPLMYWIMGVISWMLFFIECIIVSPFWVAAHGTAEREGWGTEHTRQGYMLMIGLYLNPILRVAGYFAIFLALVPLSWFVKWFSDYMYGVISTSYVSPMLIVGGTLVFVYVAYQGAIRIFSLPNEVFERGLRWLNGGQEVTGDSNNEHQTRMMVMSMGNRMGSAPDRIFTQRDRNKDNKGKTR